MKRSVKRLSIIVIFIVASGVIAGSAAAATQPVELLPNNIDLSESFAAPKISTANNGTTSISLEGCNALRQPGLPMLPARKVTLALPPGKIVVSVDVLSAGSTRYAIPQPIDWGRNPGMSGNTAARSVANPAVYKSSNPYPASQVTLTQTGFMRGVPTAVLQVVPVRYFPSAGYAEVANNIAFRLRLADSQAAMAKMSDRKPGLPSEEVFDNADEAMGWYTTSPAIRRSMSSGTGNTADYVVITPSALTGSVTSLTDYMTTQGLSVNVTTTEWIYANCSGSDNAAKIRTFLRNRYQSWGITYVLIVGTAASVPMRSCYTPTGIGEDYTPTDYYYSDLSGNWDLNADSKYGQYGVDDQVGGVDFYPEVYVGRIPNSTPADVASICTKIVAFEQDGNAWKHKAILMGAVSNYANEDSSGNPVTLGSTECERVESQITTPLGFTNYDMYEKGGLAPDPTSCNASLTRANVLAQWPSDYGVVSWWAHGSQTSSAREIWSSDDGDGVPESGEMTWTDFITAADAASLDNAHPGIVCAISCANGWAENSGSLAASLVKNGASGVVASTRSSWYSVGWEDETWGGNASLGYYFDKYLLSDGHRAGKALRLADIKFKNECLYFADQDYQTLYGFSFFGDPSMKLDQDGAPTVSSINPTGHENTGSAAVTVSGSNFMTGAAVKLSCAGQSDVLATSVSVDSPKSISCNLNLDDVLYGSWDVVVTNPDNSSSTLAGAFTVTCPTPAVTLATPGSGVTGTTVHVTNLAGSNFRSSATVQLRKTGQTPITATSVTRVSSTQIDCYFNLSTAVTGQWNVYIENEPGKSGTLNNGFTVIYPAPTIDYISPSSGLNNGSVAINDLAGTFFRDGATVTLKMTGQADRTATGVTVESANKISCVFNLSGAQVGNWDVVVKNDDNQSATLPGGFTVEYPQPVVTSITPGSGSNNGSVSITNLAGNYFRSGATVCLYSTVPDITASSVVVESPTKITCAFDLSGAAVGSRSVRVTNSDTKNGTRPNCFTVEYPPPTVSSISPSSGTNDRTVAIDNLQGTYFRTGATVTLKKSGQADISATGVIVESATKITCSLNLNGRTTGAWDVWVTNDDAKTGSKTGAFTIEHPAPAISSIHPTSGTNDGIVAIDDLEGANFRSGASVKLHKAGLTDVTATGVTVVSDSKITCSFNLSGKQVGAWDVVVINNDAKSATGSALFTVEYPPPTMSSATPGYGYNDGTVRVNIGGGGFRSGMSAKLTGVGSDINATGVTVSSGSAAACTFNLSGASLGTRSVLVGNDDGKTASLTDGFEVRQRPVQPAPAVSGISPASTYNDASTGITISGSNFRSGARTWLERTGCSSIEGSVSELEADRIEAAFNTNGARAGSWSLRVLNPDATEDTLDDCLTIKQYVQPARKCTFYLAEGTSDYGFDTHINIENPNSTAVTAEVTYMTKAGPESQAALTLPAMSQTAINPRDDIGSTDFSTKVECREGKTICVDRRMTWTGTGAASQEGHSSVGVTSPAKTWYLAEGSSKWGFETWLLIQNPNASPAECTVTYMTAEDGAIPIPHTIPANSRASFSMETDIGRKDASIKVESNIPVIPERAMYRNNRREGHDSIGTTIPAKDYYLAEGTTDWGFTTYVLVQNPNASANTVNITYMTTTGPVSQPAMSVPANSRQTVRVNDVLPAKDLSIHVAGSLPLIAERAMYWNTSTGEACHDSIGMDSPHTTFYLPDGETTGGYETWTLVQNPNSSQVQVDIFYLTPTGKGNLTRTENIPANSRKSFSMAAHSGISGRGSVIVTCKTTGKKIMVERAMYWNNRGAGTDTIGGFGD